MSVTNTIRNAILADLQDITVANGFNKDIVDAGKEPLDLRTARRPCAFINTGSSGEGNPETIGGERGEAVQRFVVTAAIDEADNVDSMDDFTDDIRNCFERATSNTRALFSDGVEVAVVSWDEVGTDDKTSPSKEVRHFIVRAQYQYTRGGL